MTAFDSIIQLILISFLCIKALTANNLNKKNLFTNIINRFKPYNSLTMNTVNIYDSTGVPSWDDLSNQILSTPTGLKLKEELILREQGKGKPHTDAKLRLFDSDSPPRVIFYRDTAAWCPYCQKVWMLLEEKRIPYIVEKINMRSYGDKPSSYLRLVPNGLLPAISLDGNFQTESLDIMLNLDAKFQGSNHISMWPKDSSPEASRALSLMRLERDLFSRWCNLVFRPNVGTSTINKFIEGLDIVNNELKVTSSPWFLNDLSIVDLTYLSHIERMCASVLYWCGIKIRGNNRWDAINKWFDAFELRPSYLATKSDYYTHVMDIPPQYGPGYSLPESEPYAQAILGKGNSWRLPLKPFSPDDIEPISPAMDPGEEASRLEAAFKVINNHEAIVKFALRGAGQKGAKQFQAPLADPYATPNLNYFNDADVCLRQVINGLINGFEKINPLIEISNDSNTKKALLLSLQYLLLRIGVPRDMSYPAARQLRAHINYIIDKI